MLWGEGTHPINVRYALTPLLLEIGFRHATYDTTPMDDLLHTSIGVYIVHVKTGQTNT